MKLFSFFKKYKTSKTKDDVCMDSVIDSIFNSKPMYDKLKVKCHPDLFLDDTLKEQAESLFQRLQKVKHDINAMKLLEPEINNLYNQR